MKKNIIGLVVINFLASSALTLGAEEALSAKKRDPFIDLVDASGRIKTEDELFNSFQKIPTASVLLKGIIWDKKRPLAIINGKIYGEGATIFEGLVLEKINMDGIVLKTGDGERIKIDLKKKEKK